MVIAEVLAKNWPIWWVAQLIAIAIIVFLFLRWKPGFLRGKTIGTTLGDTLDAREQQIQQQLAAAEESRKEAARIREQAAQGIANARTEADDIVSRAQHTSEAIQKEMSTRAREEEQRIIGQVGAEIEYERRQAIQALQRRAADIVIDAAEEITRRHLEPSQDQRIIGESLTNLKEVR